MAKRILQTLAALALVAAVSTVLYVEWDEPDTCDICYRPMHQETFYRVHLESGESKDACCPRCGLRFQEDRDDVVRAEVTDFYTRQHIDAAAAYYVEGSPVHFCSHASVREDRSGGQYEVWDRWSLIVAAAREFQEENGGDIKTYEVLAAPEAKPRQSIGRSGMGRSRAGRAVASSAAMERFFPPSLRRHRHPE